MLKNFRRADKLPRKDEDEIYPNAQLAADRAACEGVAMEQ
jgi:hypothetical protein